MKETQDFAFIRQLFSIYLAFIRFHVNNLYQAYVAQRKTVHIEAQNGTTRYRILSFETFTPESGHWVIKTQCASILKEVDFGNLLNSIPVVEDNFLTKKEIHSVKHSSFTQRRVSSVVIKGLLKPSYQFVNCTLAFKC